MDEVTLKQPIVVGLNQLIANEYNPNRMPKTEMNLLKECMQKYGFLFPILTYWDDDLGAYRIIDGYHRYEALRQLNAEKVTITVLDLPKHDAVQLTVLMNRIKGMHQVEKMSDLLIKLENLGVQDEEICNNLGMEPEEYLRLKQQLGIAHAFREHHYSKAWERAQ